MQDNDLKARLEVEAGELHRQIGLLSNTLSDFVDDDIKRRKVVVDRIKAKRAEWKLLQERIEYVERHGKLPEQVRAEMTDEERERRDNALLKINNEIRSAQSMIWKIEQKLKENPNHKNKDTWEDQLAMYGLELRKLKLDKENYA